MNLRFQFKCMAGGLDVYDDYITLKLKQFGVIGADVGQIIYFKDITSVQFRNCGWTQGFFDFASHGSVDVRFIFGAPTIGKAKTLAIEMEPINEFIQRRVRECRGQASESVVSTIVNTEGRIGIMGSIHTMQGVQDLLEVFQDKVTITPQGFLGFMNKGLKGTKTIPFSSIIAIQFKEAGAVFSGYLQFTIPGGNESKGGVFSAASDENTFMFAEKKNNPLAIQIKEYIEVKVQELHAPRATQSQPATSLSDELQKLASLRDSGILSDQEFQSAKSRLISG